MKKITILALHLGFGGIEKAITSLANALCNDYEVTIVSTYKLHENPAFYIDPKVHVTYLIESNLPKKVENYKLLFFRGKWIKLLKLLYRDYLKKGHFILLMKETFLGFSMYKRRKSVMTSYIQTCDSDIVISTRALHNVLLGNYGSAKQIKIGWEHNHHNHQKKYIKNVVNSSKKLDYLVLVSKELTSFYEERLKTSHCKVVYIPNFLDEFPILPSSLDGNLITIGRLSQEKGHLDLIDVIYKVRSISENFHLDIIGAGPEEDEIKKRISLYGLSDYVTMHGFLNKEKMAPLLQKASVFILPSYTESFGIVVLEAFSYGIPAIAFDSAQGACEIIKDNWDGYLISNRDKKKMAKRILELLKSKNRRIVMGDHALKKAMHYTKEYVIKDWVKLFDR